MPSGAISTISLTRHCDANPEPGMLDTSTVILLGQLSDPAELPDQSVISAITLAELSVGLSMAKLMSPVVAK
ncbi:hypothetical protein GCM10009632_28010 [Mycolicibacterium alvei]|uniref:Uncharacterized protein n=1 Tax=Mycolicibacterium alvei TaxID=67081 RepID=A0A6N4UQH5_9MYCO|nr:hypothetical protein MALV_07970 [Mycolicibacterium alvei]